MNANSIAQRLLKHPDADVMTVDPDDPTDFTFVTSCRYYPESDRFHMRTDSYVEQELDKNLVKAQAYDDLAMQLSAHFDVLFSDRAWRDPEMAVERLVSEVLHLREGKELKP